MRTMPRLLLAVVLATSTLACATSGGNATPAAPAGPIELDGTRWKMLMTPAGRLDLRIIQFKKQGTGYLGLLKDFGLQLRSVPGIREDMVFFKLEATAGAINEYTGSYEAPGPDGVMSASIVNVSISGNRLIWNLGSAVWERVE